MSRLSWALLVSLTMHCGSADAEAAALDHAPLDFQVVVDGACAPNEALTKEAGALGVVAAEVGAKTLVSLVGGLLDEAGKDRTISRLSTSAGALYRYNNRGILELRTDSRCVRFWYGRRGPSVVDADEEQGISKLRESFSTEWVSSDDALLRTWYQLGFVEVPFIYGAVAIAATSDGSAVTLQPKVLFMRPAPDLGGSWGSASTYAVTVELSDVGQDQPFAIHGVGLQSPLTQAVMMNEQVLRGRDSGWFRGPKIETRKSDATTSTITGRYSVKAMLTSTRPGSRLARALGGALKDENDKLLAALTPKSASQAAAEQKQATADKQEALSDVFDAEIELSQAERELAAEPADSPKRQEMELRAIKARFKVDVKREAAGLPKKYNVSP